MKRLLIVTAVLEAGTGIGLIAAPSAIARLLLGAPLDTSAALTVARVAGAALLALGVACWLASFDTQSGAARGVVTAMVIYNLGAALVLAAAGLGAKSSGVALWPAVILHAALTVWCITSLLKQPKRNP